MGHPHSWIHIDPVNARTGAHQVWRIEGGARRTLLRRGWSRNSLPTGMKIKVHGFRRGVGYCKTGTRAAMLWGLCQCGKEGPESLFETARQAGYEISSLRHGCLKERAERHGRESGARSVTIPMSPEREPGQTGREAPVGHAPPPGAVPRPRLLGSA